MLPDRPHGSGFSNRCRYWGDGSGQRAHSQRCTRGCQQAASNPASHSLALWVMAIGASGVYLRRRAVEAGRAWVQQQGAKSSHGRNHRGLQASHMLKAT
jgi:hypothetical protein